MRAAPSAVGEGELGAFYPEGTAALPRRSDEEVEALALSAPPDWHLPSLWEAGIEEDPLRLPWPDVDVCDLGHAGWGAIFPAGADSRIRRALAPLLDLRREQAASRRPERYQGRLTYHSGESSNDLLRRLRVPPGPVDPDDLPYYLLLVGGPEEIPFEVQFGLDQRFAVGRLDLATPDDYRRYAESVVAWERGRPAVVPEAVFFAASQPGDRATRRLESQLMVPLVERLTERGRRPGAGASALQARRPGGASSLTARPGSARERTSRRPWTLRSVSGEGASKVQLLRLLGGDERPALLLTASHGMALHPGDREQRRRQGALLCSDWRGEGPIEPSHYLGGDDLADEADVHGLLTFHFACYSAGTPRFDAFDTGEGDTPRPLSPKAFTAHLPRRLLRHPGGSALAVVGHVDRAWTTSFSWNDPEKGQPRVFLTILEQLLAGVPVGAALDWFGQVYGDHAVCLEQLLAHRRPEDLAPHERQRFARRRLASRDARSFVVLGDPAVCLKT